MEDESYISVRYHFSDSSGMSKYYNYIGAANSTPILPTLTGRRRNALKGS